MSAQHDYRPGDTVRVIRPTEKAPLSGLPYGTVFTITHLFGNSLGYKEGYSMPPKGVELVAKKETPTAKYKRGDRVRSVRHTNNNKVIQYGEEFNIYRIGDFGEIYYTSTQRFFLHEIEPVPTTPPKPLLSNSVVANLSKIIDRLKENKC